MLKKNAKKKSTIHELTNEEMDARYAELKKEQMQLRFSRITGNVPNVKRINQIKKEVARILTVKRMREIEEIKKQFEAQTVKVAGEA